MIIKTITGKTIYVVVTLLCLLSTSMVWAAQDPITWAASSPAPAFVGSPTSTVYTITNEVNSTDTKLVTFTTNNSAFIATPNSCSLVYQQSCNVTVTFTPTLAGNVSLQLMMHYGVTAVPLPTQTIQVSQAPTPTPTPTPDPTPGTLDIGLTASPMSLNFSMPGTTGAQSILFTTNPLIADEVVIVSNLPNGVTGASSCTTDSSGTCSILFTASKSAYGSDTLTVSAVGVKAPPAPIVSVSNTTISVADSTYISATGTTLTLSNTGNFDWQSSAANAVQLAGDEKSTFGLTNNCTANNVEAKIGTCTISVTPKNNAHAGNGVQVVVGSNATQNGNGNVYINGGVTATLSNDTFTGINQIETVTLKNVSSSHAATITNAVFTNAASNIHNVSPGVGTCGTLPTTLNPNSTCTVTYTSQASSYGSDSITVNYEIGSHAQTVESSVLTVAPTTLTLTPNSTPSSKIESGNFINLASDSSSAQSYTISGTTFDWQNPGVTLTNAPTAPIGEDNLFSSIDCHTYTNKCVVTFNTSLASIKTLNFNPDTIVLNVSGDNIGATASSWNVAPVVGEYMQGGVVFWVGSNTDNTQPGYRKALVSAVKDIAALKLWSTSTEATGVKKTGLFTGLNNTATGLENTNAICSLDNGTTGGSKCKTSGSNYPAAAAAQQYTDGIYYDWFLPAASSFTCASNTGELCELYLQRAIINTTAERHGGSDFQKKQTTSSAYWSSSERQDSKIVWFVFFFDGSQNNGSKNTHPLNLRPVRTFNY